uniref:Putative homing endonuclease n=1 Tax=viral metagenome TaxID=1070528 RepID=A0A6M3LD53_9ZZZZ
MEDFGGKCAYCGQPATGWDHIVPVAHGGQTTPGNVVPACSSCNSSKKTRDVLEWLDSRGLEPNPALYDRMILALIHGE